MPPALSHFYLFKIPSNIKQQARETERAGPVRIASRRHIRQLIHTAPFMCVPYRRRTRGAQCRKRGPSSSRSATTAAHTAWPVSGHLRPPPHGLLSSFSKCDNRDCWMTQLCDLNSDGTKQKHILLRQCSIAVVIWLWPAPQWYVRVAKLSNSHPPRRAGRVEAAAQPLPRQPEPRLRKPCPHTPSFQSDGSNAYPTRDRYMTKLRGQRLIRTGPVTLQSLFVCLFA